MPRREPITVITPVRNGMPWLTEAIHSIQAQQYPCLDMVVIDDGSSDGTLDYVASIESMPIRVLQTNGIGPSAARNEGIRACNSPWIAFLDADDEWAPAALDALSDALVSDPNASFARGRIRNFRVVDGMRQFFTVPYRYLNLGACLWRRDALESVGLLAEGLKLCEDLDLLMRAWERDVEKIDIDGVVLHYRRHAGNMTRGLSGAGFGTVSAYKRRIDRIRRGEFDPNAPRRCSEKSYIGSGPPNQDEVYMDASA